MKRFLILGITAVAVACAENPNQPKNLSSKSPNLTVLAPPGINLLQCFEGTGAGTDPDGTCTASADHKKAVLANTSSDTDGDVSGVYSDDLTVYGQYLRDITDLSYTYKSLNNPAHVPTPGELIYEVSIDTNGNGDREFWAYIDAAYCGKKSGATVNIVTMADCPIYTDISGPFANWAAFVAAYPGAKVENLHDYIMIISYRAPSSGPETWQISNVTFGKTGLVCFDGPKEATILGGLCTPGKDFMSATLDNLDSYPDGGYSGVYSRETTGYGLFLSNIKDLSFKYKPLNAPQAGELTYLIPISNNFTGSTDFTAVVDIATCLGKVATNGVGTVNITKDLACDIYDGATHYANWAAFAAAYPNAKTATDHSSSDRTNWITLIARRAAFGFATRFVITDIKWGAKIH